MKEGSQGGGRSLTSPQFPNDDGSADVDVRAVIAAASAGHLSMIAAARVLRDARLLAAVAAVLDAVDEAGADKDSHMAVVSMVNDRGEKGMLAFTGTDAMAAWDPQARPVPALGRDLARAAIDDGSSAVVVDVAGPSRLVLDGALLTALADEIDIDRISALVHAALAPLTADGWVAAQVVDGRPTGEAVDVIVRLSAAGGGHPDGRTLVALVRQAAEILGARSDIQRLVPGGIGVALDEA